MRESRRARRRCESLVRELDLPRPFNVVRLCENVARLRGRSIRLLPAAFPDPSLCGLWIASESTDYLIYEETTSALHQDHIILHELGHVLCGHGAGAVPEMFRTLEAGTVKRMLGRTSYGTAEEREAELVASLIRGRSRYESSVSAPLADDTPVGERIRLTFEHGQID